MVAVHFDTRQLRDLGGRFQRVTPERQQGFIRMVESLGKNLATEMRSRAPVGKGPAKGRPRLRDTIQSKVNQRGARSVSLSVFVAARHAWYVVYGTRPHPITPKPPRRYLRFTVGGRVVFARRVNHLGTRPNRKWIDDAVQATGIERELGRYAGRVTRDLVT
jgi:hypothetical protein